MTMRKLIAAVLLASLAISTPAIANNGKGKGPETTPAAEKTSQGNDKEPVIAPTPNTEVAEKAQEQAVAKAEEKKNVAEEKVAEAVAVKEEAKEAVAAQKAAEQEVKKLEEQVKSSAATPAIKSALDQAKERAEAAAIEAKEKTKEATVTSKEAASAKAAAAAAASAAKALNKVKGAAPGCIELIETGKPSSESCEVSRYVIRFNAGVDPDLQVKGMKAIKIPVKTTLKGVFSGAVADINAGQLKALVASGKIRSVEQDYEIKLDPTAAGDTQLNATWGLDRIDQTALPLSGSYTNPNTGSGVKAYIVDTGVLTSHSEFAGRIASGFTAVSDANGVNDCNGHGTHVAGTVAGATYGVAKLATVVPVRVLDCAGSGYLSSVISGLDWIGSNHAAGTPAVVNMSLGGGASSTLDSAVEALVSKGLTVVVAAGNSAADACTSSPARTPGALTIAASNSTDGFASFSNFGSCVDLIAPGVSITSAWIGSSTATAQISGTSMASPHVAGLVASAMTAGYLAPNQVEFVIESGAAGSAISSAPAGTANLLAQVVALAPTEPKPEVPTESVTVPVAPVLTEAAFSKNTARISWTISPDGGSPLLSHSVRVWERGQLVRKVDVAANVTTARLTGLKWGVSYTFTVVATNAIGTSVDSAVTSAYTPRR
ncbi:S8 family serine peptidase [Aquiluna sp. KACHI24]|uniref:S8 family serine peptidase n=1 Tax=Aquiluna sp. KACHI24 TaxID=2968831 RepID=UPI00220C4DFD|nr:S8 family serine peptidase [Aquiluna sp. KACHI24]BDP99770.1 hypothetical protein AKACHI_01070 [Aquiluna sp. KACHI24]